MHLSCTLSNCLCGLGAISGLCSHYHDVHMALEAAKPLIICLCSGSHCWCICHPAKAPVVAHGVCVVVGHPVKAANLSSNELLHLAKLAAEVHNDEAQMP